MPTSVSMPGSNIAFTLHVLRGSKPAIELMPTGGINPANIKDYLAIPRVLACGGTWMVDKKLIEAGNWEELARLTREAVALVNE